MVVETDEIGVFGDFVVEKVFGFDFVEPQQHRRVDSAVFLESVFLNLLLQMNELLLEK